MDIGFLGGFLGGTAVSVLVAGTVSLMAPLPPDDPGTGAQVDLSTPAGSGFNAERQDTNPVLPNDQAQQPSGLAEVTQPGIRPQNPAGSGPSLPEADTSVAPVSPVTVGGVDLPSAGTDADGGALGTDVAIVTPLADPSPSAAGPSSRITTPSALDSPGITIPDNRLPQIEAPVTEVTPPSAEGTPSTTDQDDPATQDDQAVTADAASVPAYIRNASAFTVPDGLPLMAIVLIDAGVGGMDVSMLASIGFPVTFVVDPTVDGATERAAYYRNAGFEVLAMAPSGLTADNVGDAAQAISTVMPTALGMLERPGESLQGDGVTAAATVETLQVQGLALLAFRNGLNQAVKDAQRVGLPAGVVFRELDGEQESSLTMKRYLDRAALKAGQDGSVVMVGRTLPETVTALFSWAQTTRARSVALAPLSAVLLAN